MYHLPSRAIVAGPAFAVLAIFATPAFAEMITYTAEMKGSSEVPPTDSQGSGTVAVTYDTASKQLSWKGTYSGLSGAATAAHFHGPAEVGKNADVVIPITPVTSPMAGMATLTDSQAADLAAGKWYVNVHTAKYPKGEIRGQVVRAP